MLTRYSKTVQRNSSALANSDNYKTIAPVVQSTASTISTTVLNFASPGVARSVSATTLNMVLVISNTIELFSLMYEKTTLSEEIEALQKRYKSSESAILIDYINKKNDDLKKLSNLSAPNIRFWMGQNNALSVGIATLSVILLIAQLVYVFNKALGDTNNSDLTASDNYLNESIAIGTLLYTAYRQLCRKSYTNVLSKHKTNLQEGQFYSNLLLHEVLKKLGTNILAAIGKQGIGFDNNQLGRMLVLQGAICDRLIAYAPQSETGVFSEQDAKAYILALQSANEDITVVLSTEILTVAIASKLGALEQTLTEITVKEFGPVAQQLRP